MTSKLGTIDNANNRKDISHSIYITENDEVDDFTITAKVVAKNYEIPQIYTYTIPVTGIIKQVDKLLPESGYKFCGLDALTCEIKFNRDIVDCQEDNYVALVEYDTDKCC